MKLKMIAAALALAAAGSANAAISTSASGNGELFLVVNDAVAGYSFVADLGILMDGFNRDLTQSFALNAYSQWAAFHSAIGNLDNATFGVLALDSTGTAAGNDRMWTTSSTAITADTIGATQSKQLGTATPIADVLLGKLNSNADVLGGDMASVANGSAFSAVGSTTYWDGNMGIDMKNKLPFSVMVAANEAANFGFMVTAGTQTSLAPVAYDQAGKWSFENNNEQLIYAPVPEPETYALMLAGLGLVGFMARRRNAA